MNSKAQQRFVDRSRTYLSRVYLPKIKICVGLLSDDDLWWKPNPVSNSVGNLLLHLAGNLRQWVVSGLGGTEDVRQRHLEFAPERKPGANVLMPSLTGAVSEADAVLSRLDLSVLASQLIIQGQSVTGFKALYQAVEHFSGHTGQIVYITKLRTGRNLSFYEVADGIALPRWSGHDDVT